jgi:hypothetical protein
MTRFNHQEAMLGRPLHQEVQVGGRRGRIGFWWRSPGAWYRRSLICMLKM